MEMTDFNICEGGDIDANYESEFNIDELKNFPEKAADLLSKKLIPLYKIIESLNVVNGDLIQKSDAFHTLSAILERLKPSSCSEKELNLLLRFLLPRYSEHYVYTSPVLRCILHILNFGQVSESDSQSAWQTLFKESQIQTMEQTDRYLYFSSLYVHLWKHLDLFPESTLSHLIYSIDGERDPEVLFVAFLCLQIVAHPLKKFEKSFFEAISPFCPITYKSAEHEKISASDLRSALTHTLCASEYYIRSAVSLLLEEENVLEAATALLIYPSGPDMCPNLIHRITTGLLLDDSDLACKLLGRLSSSICASSHLVFQPFIDAIFDSSCELKPIASILNSASFYFIHI